jgi:RNA-directed DNA polymerase
MRIEIGCKGGRVLKKEASIALDVHQDSYGYRLRRSAIDAIRVARQRCWRYDWVVDIDIKDFSTTSIMSWVVLYIERWLKASASMAVLDGT